MNALLPPGSRLARMGMADSLTGKTDRKARARTGLDFVASHPYRNSGGKDGAPDAIRQLQKQLLLDSIYPILMSRAMITFQPARDSRPSTVHAILAFRHVTQ